jgi:hypothetical protein
MATVTVRSGICGFTTVIRTEADDLRCRVVVETDCPNVERLRAHLNELDALRELSWKGDRPLTYELAEQHLPHTSCPVPSGMIKAVEVACKLALPADAVIQVRDED